jgi:hypothetical protein
MADVPSRPERPLPERAAESQVEPMTSRLASELHHALEGAVYPLGRTQLVWVARENDAPAEVLSALAALPEARFDSVEEVGEALTGGEQRPPAAS